MTSFWILILTILSSCIIANSHATSNQLSRRFRNKTRVVYNGIDIKWLQDDRVLKTDLVKDDWSVIMIVARISKWKRHDIVLSAFVKVATSDPKMHLICLSDEDKLETEWCNYLDKQSNESPFSDRIHWVGKVEDVRPWYRSGAILVLGSDNEPLGRVILEAMAGGVPVIATRGGGVPEIIRHQQEGLLVDAGNHEKMACAIEKALNESQLRERIIESISLKFPEVKIICLKENQGFAKAGNEGLKHCKYDVVVFLNNDMAVADDFLISIGRHFNDRQIFAVRLGIRWLTEDGITTNISKFFLIFDFRYGFIECPMLRLKKAINPFFCAYESRWRRSFRSPQIIKTRRI